MSLLVIIVLFLGVGEYLESGGECENAFVCVCMSVCMCVLSRSSKTLDGTPEGEEMYEKFSFLAFRDFGLGAKFVQKLKSMLRVSGRKWCRKFGGCTKIHFSSYFYCCY